MTDLIVHTCPRCELTFNHLFELRVHLDEDHPRPDDVEVVDDPPVGRFVVVALDPIHPHPVLVEHAVAVAVALGLGVELLAAADPRLVAEARAHVRANATSARAFGATAVRTSVEGRTDARGAVLDHLFAADVDLVALAPRARHNPDRRLGSTAAAVCAHSPVPVLLVGHRVDVHPVPIERIVACVDGDGTAPAVLAVAAGLRGRLGSALHVVEAIAGDVELPPDVHESNQLRRYVATLAAPPTTYDVLHGRHADAAIERYVGDGAGTLAVVGTHGRTGVDRVLHGSVASRVIDRLRCPVVVVPPTVTGQSHLSFLERPS